MRKLKYNVSKIVADLMGQPVYSQWKFDFNDTVSTKLRSVQDLDVDLVWLTWNLIVPLSAQICLGWRELGRHCLAGGQNGGALKSKSTKPRSMTRWDTLYHLTHV